MNLCDFLKEKRNGVALTQKEAGELLGYKRSQFISSLERGGSRPPISVLKKMCLVYRVSENEMKRAYLEDVMENAQAKALRAWDDIFE